MHIALFMKVESKFLKKKNKKCILVFLQSYLLDE